MFILAIALATLLITIGIDGSKYFRWDFLQSFPSRRPAEAGIKAALNMLGLPAGFPREPLLPLKAADEAKVRAALVRYRALPAAGRRDAAE